MSDLRVKVLSLCIGWATYDLLKGNFDDFFKFLFFTVIMIFVLATHKDKEN